MRCIATRTRTAAVVSFSPLLRALRELQVRPDPLAVRPLPRVRVTWVEVVDPECRFDLDAMQVKGYDWEKKEMMMMMLSEKMRE